VTEASARPRITDPQLVDEAIDEWAGTSNAMPLYQYLGWTLQEYQEWVAHARMVTLDE
jgi:hypothetical protein